MALLNRWEPGKCVICGDDANHALCHDEECMDQYVEGMMFIDNTSVQVIRTTYDSGAREIIMEMNRLFDKAAKCETDAEGMKIVRDGCRHLFQWYCDVVGPWSDPGGNDLSTGIDEPIYANPEETARRLGFDCVADVNNATRKLEP